MTDPSYLNDPVVVSGDPAMTPEAMRALEKATGGQSMSSLMQGESDADRFQAMAFLELHRRASKLGHMPDAGTLWEQAGTIEIVTEARPDRAADPLDGGPSTTPVP